MIFFTPANYCSFVDSFGTLIYPVIYDTKQRFYLLKYTKGLDHTLVKGCQYMPSLDGYDTARKLFQENLEKKFQIAQACVDKILVEPPLNQNNKPITNCVFSRIDSVHVYSFRHELFAQN